MNTLLRRELRLVDMQLKMDQQRLYYTSEKNIPETTARRLKKEYLLKLKEVNKNAVTPSPVKRLPTKAQGRPLLVGEELDSSIQAYINNLREVGGVVNSSIVMAAAKGIINARDPGLLVENGGFVCLTKDGQNRP